MVAIHKRVCKKLLFDAILKPALLIIQGCYFSSDRAVAPKGIEIMNRLSDQVSVHMSVGWLERTFLAPRLSVKVTFDRVTNLSVRQFASMAWCKANLIYLLPLFELLLESHISF